MNSFFIVLPFDLHASFVLTTTYRIKTETLCSSPLTLQFALQQLSLLNLSCTDTQRHLLTRALSACGVKVAHITYRDCYMTHI